ncbi:MAG: tRNA epoxyqueuosine(34) reductase QueG [Candidatus Tectomicrobia bacterium]|nr:tRNA epoxyqueuosine(34) reductase QueG [Candidatus Tectomicrobia bacterium]
MKTFIKEQARQLGFDLVGVAAAGPQQDFPRYAAWVALGYAGKMAYLQRQPERRADVRALLPSARSVVVCGMNYHLAEAGERRGAPVPRGRVAEYARGDDYHNVLEQRLGELLRRIQAHSPQPLESRIYVDTGAVLERAYGRDAGLGWVGKNTCLINRELGSLFFIGEILLSLALEPDTPDTDHCGTCQRCLEACPTDAFAAPYQLDARRCISYLTIELRDGIPEELRAPIGEHLFGCDICQQVCPWNQHLPSSTEPAFAPRAVFDPPRLADLALWSADDFRAATRRSPIKRAKYSGFLRTVAVAIGNSGNPQLMGLLDAMPTHEPLVAEHIAWARERLAEVAQVERGKTAQTNGRVRVPG